MTTSKIATAKVATGVRFDDQTMSVDLSDGQVLSVPLSSFPRLLAASAAEREEVTISTRGLHWEALDEDISIAGLLSGRGDRTVRQRSGRAA